MRTNTFQQNDSLPQEVLEVENRNDLSYIQPFIDDRIIHLLVEQTNLCDEQTIKKLIVVKVMRIPFVLKKCKELALVF